MTNFEKYQKELAKIAVETNMVGLSNGIPIDCSAWDCKACDWYDSGNCNNKLVNWLNQEYTEPKIQPEVKDLKVDDKVLVSHDNYTWRKRYFCRYDSKENLVYAFDCGATSWTTNLTTGWKYAKLPDE